MQPFPHPKNLIWIKISFSGQHWTGPSIEKSEKSLGVTKDQFQEWLSQKTNNLWLIHRCNLFSPKCQKTILRNENKHQNSLSSTSTVFPGLEPILYAGQNLCLTAKFFRKLFLVVDCPTKKNKKLVEKATRKKVKNNWKKHVFLENLLF